jgi:hypothetical protein
MFGKGNGKEMRDKKGWLQKRLLVGVYGVWTLFIGELLHGDPRSCD